MGPAELLVAARDILDPVFEPFGMDFDVVESGISSGGRFAVGSYSGSGWAVRLHVHDALGIIEYQHEGHTVPYDRFARGNGIGAEISYPGFADGDPLATFKRFRDDLERFPQLRPTPSSVEAFLTIAIAHDEEQTALSRRFTFESSREGQNLRAARDAWKAGEFAHAAELYATVPVEWQTDLDKRRLSDADARETDRRPQGG